MASTGQEWAKGAARRARAAPAFARSLSGLNVWQLAAVGVPIVVFVVHSSLFWGWIVDDAGISFAYARNLAHGHGLVSQPGLDPVEGYSNSLWVGLLAPFSFLGVFDAAVTPKVVSLVLVGASFLAIYKTMALAAASNAGGRWAQLALGLPLLLLSLNTSFVVWTTSGLENPLFVLELSLLLYFSMRAVVGGEASTRHAVALGVLAAAAGMTRPDGVLLAAPYPLLIAGGALATRRLSSATAKHLTLNVASFALPFAAFTGTRLLYFGELYPNTYRAKGGVTTEHLTAKANDLLDSVVGFSQAEVQWLVLAAVVAGIFATRRPAMRVAGAFMAASALGVLLLPQDWMRENRFCSLFVASFYVVVGMEALYLVEEARLKLSRRVLSVGLAGAGALLAFSAGGFIERSIDFSRDPTVPLGTVRTYFGDRFEDYARTLGVEQPSLLTLDVGGVLYYSHLRVYDLAGLTDKTIAKTLVHDQTAFYDYVFEDLKPTFVHTHGLYAVYASLDQDPRFRKMYRPICEQTDPWVEHVWHFYWYAGDYVRWDVGWDDATVLEMAKQCKKELPYPGN